MHYIIFNDSYMGEAYGAESFRGTYRQLLLKLCGFEAEEQELEDWNNDYNIKPKTVKDIPDDEMVKMFNDANGDGQPYYVVWSVDEEKKVLG